MCSLPLTGVACVDRVITDLGVLDVTEDETQVLHVETAPGVGADEIVSRTAAPVRVPDAVG